MNYSQKRTLIGRIVYIGLTLMAVTILSVTMYTFFGSSREATKTPPVTTAPQVSTPDVSRPSDVTTVPPVTVPPATSDNDSKPTVVPPATDWTKVKVDMPVNGVIVKKHDLVNAVYSVTMEDYRVHRGVDIECQLGDMVTSCAYGTVLTVGEDPFMGTCVSIDHGDGLISYYRNLNPTLAEGITVGTEVHAGQMIGAVGESAIIEIAEEAHLHFELELNGEPVDPMTMLDYDESTALEENAENDQ